MGESEQGQRLEPGVLKSEGHARLWPPLLHLQVAWGGGGCGIGDCGLLMFSLPQLGKAALLAAFRDPPFNSPAATADKPYG